MRLRWNGWIMKLKKKNMKLKKEIIDWRGLEKREKPKLLGWSTKMVICAINLKIMTTATDLEYKSLLLTMNSSLPRSGKLTPNAKETSAIFMTMIWLYSRQLSLPKRRKLNDCWRLTKALKKTRSTDCRWLRKTTSSWSTRYRKSLSIIKEKYNSIRSRLVDSMKPIWNHLELKCSTVMLIILTKSKI